MNDFEVLAVNDRSSDDSATLLQAYARQDPRIRLLDNPGSGLVAALNHGLNAADTELIARMDADDRMHPQRLAAQYAHMKRHRETVVLGCCTRSFPNPPSTSGWREYLRWQNRCNQPDRIRDEIYIESPFAHPSVMFRKQPVTALGGYYEGNFPEDYELWLRVHQAGHRMEKLPRVLLDWRDHPHRTSRTDPRCSRDAFDALRARYLARDPRLLARGDRLVIWGAGRKTRLRCRHLMDYGLEPKAYIDIDPRKIGNRIKTVPVVAPEWLEQNVRRWFVLIYVANHGARELIAEQLTSMRYRRGRDFLAVG